jgi:hypothetical protein
MDLTSNQNMDSFPLFPNLEVSSHDDETDSSTSETERDQPLIDEMKHHPIEDYSPPTHQTRRSTRTTRKVNYNDTEPRDTRARPGNGNVFKPPKPPKAKKYYIQEVVGRQLVDNQLLYQISYFEDEEDKQKGGIPSGVRRVNNRKSRRWSPLRFG